MIYANDNRRKRTPADEQLALIGIVLGAAVLFVTFMWLAG
jgi:hypothetical protein